MRDFVILTDSGADLPKEITASYEIGVIDLMLQLGDTAKLEKQLPGALEKAPLWPLILKRLEFLGEQEGLGPVPGQLLFGFRQDAQPLLMQVLACCSNTVPKGPGRSPGGQRRGWRWGAAGERKRGRGWRQVVVCHRGRQGKWAPRGRWGRYRSCLWGKQRHQEDKAINEDAFQVLNHCVFPYSVLPLD